MTNQGELQRKIIDKSVTFFKNNKKGYLDVAMRVGKTFIAIEIFKNLDSGGILIAYPDNKLKDSWLQEFEKWKYKNENVYFTNFSSLKKYVTCSHDIFCIDEWHSLSEQELEYAKQISNNCEKTLGLSGTISKDTKDKWPEFKEIAKYTTLEGINDGILASYQITVHLVDLDTQHKIKNKKGKLTTEKQRYDAYSWVINKNRQEGKPTMHLALARNRLSLSSIGKMNYLRGLLDKMLKKRVIVFTGLADVADNIGIPSYHSKSANNGSFSAFQGERINHLALAAMGKVGVTYPNLDSVILLNFTYNAEESSQILNRAIKLDYHGKIADLHVICLNEPAEIKKVKESLSMLDKTKIKYV